MAQKPRSNRWSGWLKRKPSILRPFPSLRFEELEVREVPASFTWSGLAGGGNNNWSTGANWVGGVAPTGVTLTDDLVFPAGPTVRTANNDILGGTVNSISFSTTVPNAGYTLTGNSVILGRPGIPNTGFITVNGTSTGNIIQFDTALGSGPTNQFFTIGGSLTITGHISGNPGSSLTKDGTGILTLSADNSQYFGSIAVNPSSGILAITDANALGSPGAFQPDDSLLGGTTIGTNSTLQVSNVAGSIGESLLLNGPGSNSAGALFNAAGNNTWTGPIKLGTGSATAGVVVGAAADTILAINATVSDKGSGQILSKEGAGTVQLNAANTYRGLTIINSGVLSVGNKDALGKGGDAASGTIVTSAVAQQGQLRLADFAGNGFTIFDEFLTLNGAGQALIPNGNRGSLTNTVADNTWAGPVTLGSPTPNGVPVTIGTGGGTLTISGIISTPNGVGSPSGSSSLTKIDIGELIFNNANTYSCPTFVTEGTLDIRDSKALGTNAVTVLNGATLQMDVEAGIGGLGLPAPRLDAHGRQLDDDSVTHDAHRLQVANVLTITGLGVNRVGALYSATGINVWTSTISISGPGVGTGIGAAIGVDLDPRPGHPSADSSYFVNDYSLTANNTIQNIFPPPGVRGTLHKVQLGQLILPVANTYTGRTFVEAGWVTVENDRSLGARIPLLAQTLQPETFVSSGAAVHLRTLFPTDPPLHVDENLILSGTGPLLPYKFISQKGALMSIGGDNVVGVDISNTWFTYVAFNGLSGIGVEQVAPLVPSAGQDPSHLTIVGMTRNDNVTNPPVPVAGGLIKLGSRQLTLVGDGTYTLATDIREGAIAARNHAALGLNTSGTFTTSELYTQTTTTVQSGANLRLDTSVPQYNGGVGSGIQITDEQLVLNSPAQQIAVAGAVTPAPSRFFLSFTNNKIGPAATTAQLVPGLTGAEMQAALFALPSIHGTEQQTVAVTGGAGTFTLTFNGQTTGPIVFNAIPAAVAFALNGLSSVQRPEIQVVDVVGAAGTFTLTFNGASTAPIPAGSSGAFVQGVLNGLSTIGPTGSVVVVAAPIAGGTSYMVTFNGGTVNNTNVPPMTVATAGGVTATVTTTQDGLGGIVGVTSSPVAGGQVYTIDYGNFLNQGDLAYQDLSQVVAAGIGGATATANTIRDGINGSVSVSDNLAPGPGGGNLYSITFGGDLANQDVQPLVATTAPNDGTLPLVTTVQPGSGTQSEIQSIKVVAATGSYTLTYTSPSDPLKSTHPGATATTVALPITAPSVQVQSALNALQILLDDVGSVVVTRAGNIYTVVFGNVHSTDTPLLVANSIVAPLGTPEITISGATTIDGYASEASLVSLTQDNAWRGPVTLNAGSRIATQANTRINLFGSIDDATNLSPNGSGLVKRGQGEVVLAALNSFRGSMWADEGITTAANSGSFGATALGTIVANNAQLQIQGSLTIAGEPLTLQGTGVPTASTLSDQWFNLGSASTNNVFTAGNQPTSARVTSVTTDPTDPNVIYVATAGGGAWKSKNHGVTWVPLFDSTVDPAAVIYGGSIVVAPSDPNILYFATGEANGGPNGTPVVGQQDNFAGTGVYVSFNAGATWTLVTGPGSNNPLFGLATTKLIVDPTQPLRIYVATASASVIHGIAYPLANNVLSTAVAGVYRYDGAAATPDWVNLTASPSNNRRNLIGGAPFDVTPPGNAGPDDDYRIKFPQTNAAWSDIALVQLANPGGPPSPGPGFGARAGNTITNPDGSRHVWALYAALGESQQAYFGGVANQGVFNAVYRTEDPANTFAPGTGPTWWIGQGTVYPVACDSSDENPKLLSDCPIPPPTPPDSRDDGPGAAAYLVGEIVFNPNNPHAPGRNEFIKISAVVTRYFNVDPADGVSNLLLQGRTMNASIRVYSTELGNSVDVPSLPVYWPYPTRIDHTGEFLDIQMSGWDGGIATAWTPNIAGPTTPVFGLTSANSQAVGRYAHALTSPDSNFGKIPLVLQANRRDNVYNETLYFAGKDEIYQTSNALAGAPTWTAISSAAGAPADFYHSLFIDHVTGNLYAGSDGGLWFDVNNSTGTTHSYRNLNGNLTAVQLNAADPHPSDFNQALAASYNNGLQQFKGSLAWQGQILPAAGDRSRDAGDVRYDPTNPDIAFAAAGGNLFRTQDGGLSWSQVFNAFTSNNFPVYVDPINPSRVLIGGAEIRESTQGGFAGTFVPLNGGTANALAPAVYQGKFVADPGFPTVTDKLSNTYDSDTIYTTDGATVRVTKNRGVTWISRPPAGPEILYTVNFAGALINTDVPTIGATAGVTSRTLRNGGHNTNEIQTLDAVGTSGTFTLFFNGFATGPIPFGATSLQVQNALQALPSIGAGNATVESGPGLVAITDIAVDPTNRDIAYATMRYTKGQTGLTAVYRTTNAGRSWQDISGALPTVQTWTVVVDPRTDTLFIGNDQGVWQLNNASLTQTFSWTRFGAGMPEVQVHDLTLNQTLNTLTAATYGRGLFQLLLTGYEPSPGALRVISGNSLWSGPVTLTGNTTITADGTQEIQNGYAAASLNIQGAINDGTVGNNSTITKSGLGTITFSGSNVYGGQTLVQQGVLIANNPTALGLASANTVVAAGAALGLESDLQAEPILINGDGIKFNGHFTGALHNLANNNVYTGTLTLGTNTTIGAESGTTLTIGEDPRGNVLGVGTITDLGNNFTIDKELAGTLVLANANTYGGTTTVDQGALRVENTTALGSVGPFSGTTVLDGAQVQISRNAKTHLPTVITSEPLFLSGTGVDVTGALRNVRGDTDPTGSNDNTWAGPITFTITPAFLPQSNPGSRIAIGTDDSGLPGIVDTLNIATNIQQDLPLTSFGLIKVGAGRLTLQQANSFTGTTEVGVNIGGRDFPGGSLRIENANSLGPNATSNSVQTLSVVGITPALTYTLSFNGRTTGPLSSQASATTVQNALNALSSIGQSEQQRIAVSGSTGSFNLTFDGVTTATPISLTPVPPTTSDISNALLSLSSVRRSEVQDVLVTGTSGFFTLTFNNQTTQPLAYNSSAGQVATALNNLNSVFPTGTVSVTSSSAFGGTVYRVTFDGGILANANQTQLIAASSASATVQDGSAGASEVQTVNVFSTSGTFILTFNELTTVPLPFNASAAEVQLALNNLPSIGGLGGVVSVSSILIPGGTQYTITFGGTLANTNVNQILAAGVGGPVAAVTTIADGLNGTVTVTGSYPNFTVDFGGDLANRNLPQMSAANSGIADANATITTLRDGTGVMVTETPSVNGKVLTVTFQRPLSLAVVPQLTATAVNGLAVNVATTQLGGAGVIVNNGGGAASLEIDGDPTNLGGATGINVGRVLAINGTGVSGRANASAAPVAGGTAFTISFDGALGNANLPPLTALGIGGATAVVGTMQDGNRTRPEIQTVTVTGTAGTFTILLNGVSTAALQFDATAAQVQAALNALTGIGGTSGALNNVSGTNTYSGAVTFASNTSIGANPNTTITIPVVQDPTPLTAPAPAFTKVGLGTVVFPNANAYGGLTVVRDGVLSIQNPQAIGIGRSEMQSFSTVGTVGAFTLTFNGQTTVPLLFNVPASGGASANSSVQNALNALSSVKRTEIQTVKLSGLNTGTFTLTFGGQTTAPLAFNALASTVQTFLRGLSTIGAGNVNVTGASPSYTVTFSGTLANKDVGSISATGFGGTLAVGATVQDGLNGTATATSVAIPGGRQYTVTFGGDLANENLPQIITRSDLVFWTTTTNGSAAGPEVQTIETFVTGAQTFTLNFNGAGPTNPIAAGAPAATVTAELLALSSFRHSEIQDITVRGSSGTFRVTFNGQTTAPQLFNVSAANLQTALEGLSTIGLNNVTVVANPFTGGIVYTVSFTGALSNTNLPQMTATGVGGAVSTVATTQDGLNGDVMVVAGGPAGDVTYTITFGGDLVAVDVPQITGQSNTAASFVLPSTLIDGNGSETQYVNVTATNGTFFLTFNGPTTAPLLFTASAADVEGALNALTSIGGIGGFVRVTKAGVSNGPGGTTYTVNFGGTLADLNLPIMTATTTPGTVVNITTGNDGPEGTTVVSGATLQLNGTMIMDREVVTINGLGFQNQGALNVKGGNVTWQALTPPPLQQIPLFLGSNASIGTTASTDNLTFLVPISDNGNAFNLDIFGPGTVTYASALASATFGGNSYGPYTGTTTVHDGNLILSQPASGGPAILGPLVIGDNTGAPLSAVVRETIDNQIANSSAVLVNSDGLFDLNGHTDTIAALTVLGGTVDTKANGHLTTADVNMTGGKILIGDNGSLASANVVMQAGAMIVAGNISTLTANNVTMSGASSISFGSTGTFTTTGNVLMTGASTLDFGSGSTATTKNIDITGGHIIFADNGTLKAAGNITDNGAAIAFGNNGILNVINLTETNNASLSMGSFGTLASTGNIFLDKSTLTFTNNGVLTATGTLTAQNLSTITFGISGNATVGPTTLSNSDVIMGDAAILTTGPITMTNGSVKLGVGVVGGNSNLTVNGNVTDTGGSFAFGDSGIFNANVVSLTNGSIDFKDTGHLTAAGDVLLNNSTLAFDNAGRLDALNLTGILGSAVEFLLNGILSVGNVTLSGTTTLTMGDTAQATVTSIDATNSTLAFGNHSTVIDSGSLKLAASALSLGGTGPGSNGILQVASTTMTAASTVALGEGVSATNGNIAITGGSISAGDGSTIAAGTVTDTNGNFNLGKTNTFTASTVSLTGATFTFGTDGSFNTSGDLSLDNSSITMGNKFATPPQFGTQNVTMTNASSIALGTSTVASTLNINETGSTIALGTNAVLTLSGNITATSTVANSSQILGPGRIDVGGADRTVTVNDGPRAVDLLITTQFAATADRLIKNGAGRLEFAPTTGFAGPITIQAGDVQVDTTIGQVDMTGPTASLSGNGTVGIIDGAPPSGAAAVGRVSPGINYALNPAGTLHSATAIWGVSTTFFVNLSSSIHPAPLAGTDYDQLQVAGDLFINGAKLDGLFGSGVLLSDTFTIIQTTIGTVRGKFAEPFGANIAFIQGQKFSVAYSANQVVLTKILANIASMSVATSINPATVRQSVLFTASITPEPGAGAIPTTSTVTFTFVETTTSATFTGTVNVIAGNQAIFDTNVNLLPGNAFLPGGTYVVTATFNGDPVNFNTAMATLPANEVIEVPAFNTLLGTPGFISPNQSLGVQDALNLNVTVLRERGSVNWTFTIRDSSNAVVRTLTGTDGTGAPHTAVPISTSWNGKDTGGSFVPNGDYTVVATFTDQFTNTGTSNPITIVVDNTNPTASSLTNTNVLIAPGTGLSVPGSTELTSTVGDPSFAGHPSGTFAQWTLTITNGATTVRTFTGTNTNVDVIWNGTDASSVIVPDAAYTVTLTAVDAAGNSFSPAPQTVVVLTHPPTITVSSNTPTVYGQTITLTTTVSLPSGTPNSVIDLLNGNSVQFYKDSATLLGTGTLSSAAPGGPYMATLTVPTFNVGVYNSLFVKYLGSSNFLPGDSATTTHVVTPAPLTVTASSTVTKVYGAAVPSLTVASGVLTVVGLVNGDSASNVLNGAVATTATAASPVIAAGYPITQGTLAANANYTLSFTNGKLTVTKAPLTVIINDAMRPVHAANPPFTFTGQTLLLGDPASVVSGLTLVTTATVNSPVGSYPISATGTAIAQNYDITNIVNGTLSVIPIPTSVVVGPGKGGPAVANVYSPTGQLVNQIAAFDPRFSGGVRTATGDFNRDGVLDIAIGTGPGTTAFVRVIDGKTGLDLFDVNPLENFQGGVFLATGDINADGADDLVITPDQGGGPRVVAYSGINFAPMVSYFGINDPAFRGGARAAVGDLNGDGFADIAVSAGFEGGPRVSLWDGKELSTLHFKNLVSDFFVFSDLLRNGAYVAIGDVNGDGRGDLIAGAGPGGGPQVKIFSGADLLNPSIGPSGTAPFANFFAGDPNNRGGIRVATKSLDNDLKADLVTGVGDGGGSNVSAYLGAQLATGHYDPNFSLDAFPGFLNGVFVG